MEMKILPKIRLKQGHRKVLRLAYPDLDFRDVSSELREVINSGWLTKGPKTEEFEVAAKGYLKVREAVAVSSGTAALHLSLLAMGIGPGDEVIVPDFTFPAAANAVELCGAKAVLVDIDRSTLNISPEKILPKVNSRTRAIIPVHQFGNPADMDLIMKIARKRNMSVIEDAACALGSKYNGRMCGSIGDLGCFSFHPRKIISTGEGGLVATDDLKLAKIVRRLREHGIEKVGKERVFTEPGFNYRISEIASVLGLAQMNRIERIIAKRISLAEEMRLAVEGIGGLYVIPQRIKSRSRHIYQSFVAARDAHIDVAGLISFLRKRNIEATISNIVIHRQPYYARKYGLADKNFKDSIWAYEHTVALPFHTRMTSADLRLLRAALMEYFENGKRS